MELTVGLIVKPQGIRGELKVKPYTDDAEVFRALKSVYIDGIEYRVLNVRTGGGAAYLGLRGVPDMVPPSSSTPYYARWGRVGKKVRRKVILF